MKVVRYYGWYSHRQRGIRKKRNQSGQAESDKLTIDRSALDTQKSATGGALSAWAMLIKRVYEVDPLECPNCGEQMKIVSFIERCHRDVIEQILRHCGLWQGPYEPVPARAGPRSRPLEQPRSTISSSIQILSTERPSISNRIQRKVRASCSWCSIPNSFKARL